MMAAIRRLAADPRNAVLVLTGLTRKKLGDVFAGRGMRNVSLATSNGLVYSWGDSVRSADEKAQSAVADLERSVPTLPSRLPSSMHSESSGGGTFSNPATGECIILLFFFLLNIYLTLFHIFIFQDIQSDSRALLDGEAAHCDEDGRCWRHMDFSIDWSHVHAIAMPVINKFTWRTNGTCLSPRLDKTLFSFRLVCLLFPFYN